MSTSNSKKWIVATILFSNFELLDWAAYRFFAFLKNHFEIHHIALDKRDYPLSVPSSNQSSVCATHTIENAPSHCDILLVPGGPGTRILSKDEKLMEWLRKKCDDTEMVLSICTGALLLASAGVLNGKRCTTNKFAFTEMKKLFPKEVNLVYNGRWIEDGKFITSAGVTAGFDAVLFLISKLLGKQVATEVANKAEYEYHDDSSWDPFSKLYELEK